jgi:thiol-disulfide isomerase/thioredoxin
MKDKKIKLFIIIVVLFNCMVFGKENSVKYQPEKPKAGDELTISYNPDGNELANASSIEMRAYLWSNEKEGNYERVYSLKMEKQGTTWTAKLKTSNQTDFVALIFLNEAILENNSKNGYFIRFYDNTGNETAGSKWGFASVLSDNNWGRSIMKINQDPDKAYSIMEEVSNSNPELKRKYFKNYLAAIFSSKPKDKQAALAHLLKELEIFGGYSDLTDEEYKLLADCYTRLQLSEKANAVTEKAIIKYPKGITELAGKIESLKIDNNLAGEIKRLSTEFPGIKNSKYYSPLIQKVFNEKKTEYIKDIMQSNGWLLDDFLICSTIVFFSLVNDDNNGLTEELSKKYLTASKREFEKPVDEKNNFDTEEQDVVKRNSKYGLRLLYYAEVISRLNKKEQAKDFFEKSARLFSPSEMHFKYFEWYAQNLIDNKLFDKASTLIEERIKLGKASDKIKELCRVCYVKKQGSEEGYGDYYAKLENLFKNKNREELKERIINTPAPDFVLMNLEGKEYRLSDMKGKVVILDFWATWCGPCKASFPLMQKAIEKYSVNEDVKFFFINTFEKKENQADNAKKYIKENDYPFHVMIDKENKVANSFGVTSIPTKIFIDKKGRLRYMTAGFNAEKLLDEIDDVINLIK